jgi:hypothetical protein
MERYHAIAFAPIQFPRNNGRTFPLCLPHKIFVERAKGRSVGSCRPSVRSTKHVRRVDRRRSQPPPDARTYGGMLLRPQRHIDHVVVLENNYRPCASHQSRPPTAGCNRRTVLAQPRQRRCYRVKCRHIHGELCGLNNRRFAEVFSASWEQRHTLFLVVLFFRMKTLSPIFDGCT